MPSTPTRKQLADYAREGMALGPFDDPTGRSDEWVLRKAASYFDGGFEEFERVAIEDLSRSPGHPTKSHLRA